MKYKNIENLVVSLSKDPFNPEINFNCAIEYEKLNQTASAVSFYLRCAEFGFETNKTLTYNSLLKISKCFEGQNDRKWNVSNYILHALTVEPERPEAYFMMSQFHEISKDWQESYTMACLGLSKQDFESLPGFVGYEGKHSLEFQKAVAGWWIGRAKESKEIFNSLLTQNISDQYRNAINYNLERI